MSAAATTITISGAPGSGAFGSAVVVLPNGNVVVTDPSFDLPDGTPDVGAVRLFRADGSLVSTLTGNLANDRVGTQVIVLENGNFVVVSAGWGTVDAPFAGAVTFGDATAGVSGIVSEKNSLVGSSPFDSVGAVVPLANGNYVVAASVWNDGAAADVGAVVLCDGRNGTSGVIERAHALVGAHVNDHVGASVTALADGDYVVASPQWSDGTAVNVGAVTRGDGILGTVGTVGPGNSLVGAHVDDRVGERMTINPNDTYAVVSPHWDADAIADVGAVTFCVDRAGCRGVVGPANSLVGAHAGDLVGSLGANLLANGNYVVRSPAWGDGTTELLGAATWVDGALGRTGEVSSQNSLVGAARGDQISSNGVLALANGNYTVSSQFWHNGSINFAGAVTFGNGATGTTGVVSAANSLVGITANDSVSFDAALSNGNYVVFCSRCDIDGIVDAGAVVLGNGETGTFGAIGSANALVGSQPGDHVGTSITPLVNGNYVVASPDWSHGTMTSAGAATFVDGRIGLVGAVSAANSLVGSNTLDSVGSNGAHALANGNYVVPAPHWRNGDAAFAGAIMLADGRVGIRGEISPQNALVGEHAGDSIGSGAFVALANSDFVIGSPSWQRNGIANVGAVACLSGSIPQPGTITAQNSLQGATAGDLVGDRIRALPGDRHLVFARTMDAPGPTGPIVDAGAVVAGLVRGDITVDNAIFGKHPGSGTSTIIDANADVVAIGHPVDNEVVILRFEPSIADDIFADGFDIAENGAAAKRANGSDRSRSTLDMQHCANRCRTSF